MVQPAPSFNAAESLYQQAMQCKLDYDYLQAARLLQAAVRAKPSHIMAQMQLAFCLRLAEKQREALTVFRRALRRMPDHPTLLGGMADCYKDLGEFDKASHLYEKAYKASPNPAEALYNLLLLRDYPPHSAVVKDLHKIYDQPVDALARIMACFALGTLYERHNDYQRAFDYYEEANHTLFLQQPYDEAAHFAFFDKIEACFTAPLFERLKPIGCDNNLPIFIVGMPRSGSTLVEQILASHSQVEGAGESGIMPRICERTIPHMTGMSYPDAIQALAPAAWAQLAEGFLGQLREHCPGQSLHITDKTLPNFFHVGIIRLLFPRAVIIHCARDPMDTCWSIFRQYFGGNFPYGYDQTALGRYYRRYLQLMRHWHRVLPGEIHDVHYEQLVTEPEASIRRLLEHCGLPWEKNCLAFYRTRRPVKTVSTLQVRRPIYTTSLRSWAPVADRLVPLRDALQYELKA